GNDGEIEADLGKDAADAATADLADEFLFGGHVELRIVVPVGGQGRARLALGFGRVCGRSFGVRGCGVRVVLVGGFLDVRDVGSGGATGEQHTLEGDDAPDAALEMCGDGFDVGGAEDGGDGGEVWGGGALANGVAEMASEGEDDAEGVEHEGGARRQGG